MITTKTQRQSELDGLRGLAAMVVVATHHLAVFHPHAVFGDRLGQAPRFAWESLFFLPPLGLAVAGQFAVCLFFILSGYVLSQGHLGARRDVPAILAAIVKRPFRLGGMVLFTVMLGALVWGLGLHANQPVAALSGSSGWFDGFWSGELDVARLWSDVLTSVFSSAGRYNPPLWTIKIELYGSVYVYLFLLLFGGGMAGRWLLIMMMLLYLRESPYFGFFLGLAFADARDRRWPLGRRASAILGGVLLLAFFCLSSYPGYVSRGFIETTAYGVLPARDAMFVGYPMLAAALLFACLPMLRPLRWLLRAPALTWLGHVSYALYALHFLVLGTFTAWLFLHLVAHMDYLAAVLLASTAGLALALVLASWATTLVDRPSSQLAASWGDQASRWLCAQWRAFKQRWA